MARQFVGPVVPYPGQGARGGTMAVMVCQGARTRNDNE
jgi:hypothetical protein